MFKFSEELEEKTIKYFEFRYKMEITPEEAQKYLNTWSDLFVWAHEQGEGGAGTRPNDPPVILDY